MKSLIPTCYKPHSFHSLNLRDKGMAKHLRDGFYELRMVDEDVHGLSQVGLLLVKPVRCRGCGSEFPAHQLKDHVCKKTNLTQGSMSSA